MHQINQISQHLFSRSLGVRQPIVASAIIDQPRCEILPPPHKDSSSSTQSSKLTLWDSFIQAPQAPQAPQVLPCRAPLESQYCARSCPLCNHIALNCTGIALYCTGIVQGLGCALCIPHLMISCGSASPSIRKLQYEVTIAIAWLSHFLLEQLSLQTSLFSFLLLYPYPSMVGIFVVIRLSVGLDNFS